MNNLIPKIEERYNNDKLPFEILVLIFQNLDLSHLKLARCVSKSWCSVATFLLKKHNLLISPYYTSILYQLVSRIFPQCLPITCEVNCDSTEKYVFDIQKSCWIKKSEFDAFVQFSQAQSNKKLESISPPPIVDLSKLQSTQSISISSTYNNRRHIPFRGYY